MSPSTTNPELVPEPVSKTDEKSGANGSSLTEHERAEIAFVDKYSAPDVYINGKTETLWFPWIGPIELKPMRMENRTGTFVVGLRSEVASGLGKHRHRGTVTAVTMAGEWGYKEYDWVARPGDWVCENPGTIHTLSVEDNTEIVFTITGSIEFLNEDDSLNFALDVFSFAKLYYDYCKEKGIKPNDALWH
jgi:2,4'-dihydroxyacetophenone dioxygenase